MTVKQGRLQIRVVPPSSFHRHQAWPQSWGHHASVFQFLFLSWQRMRGKKPSAEVSQDLSINAEGTIRGRSTPDIHFVFWLLSLSTHLSILSIPPPLQLCFLSGGGAGEEGGVPTPGCWSRSSANAPNCTHWNLLFCFLLPWHQT